MARSKANLIPICVMQSGTGQCIRLGATTFSTTTHNIKNLYLTGSINDTQLCIECHDAYCHYADCHIFVIVMLSVVMPRLVLLSVIKLSLAILKDCYAECCFAECH